MHFDLDQRKHDDAPEATEFCVLGAGVAGLILTQRLAAAGHTVTLLEGGGLDHEARSQNLYATEMAGSLHTGATDGRFRTLGGSSTRWGGQLLPYPAEVLAKWPLLPCELEPYYPEAETLMQVGHRPFTDDLLPALGHARLPLAPEFQLRYSRWAPFKRRNLARTLGPAVMAHPGVRLYTHANITDFQVEQGSVTGVEAADYQGRRTLFKAERFILAAGTIESSRLLLASPAMPNSHDQLGRYFHDHVSFHAAKLDAGTRAKFFARLGPFVEDGILYTAKLEAAPALGTPVNVMAHLVIQEPEDSGTAAVRNVLTSLQRGDVRQAVTQNLPALLRGTGDIARLLWAARVRRRRAVSSRAAVFLNIDLEQPATAENRIRLASTVDALGMPKALVDWRVGEQEYRAAAHFAQALRAELLLLGFPEIDWHSQVLAGERPAMADTYHPMGGLRMGVDPAASVVDADLKLHDLANLYVASCAVYPTGGSSNPTFTLMALTMRLADHLARKAEA